jgi:class 3 adenylate cyclase/predicted ATPase
LASRCPKCGAENALSSAFCEDCGAALAGSAAPAAARSPQVASTAPQIHVTPERPEASTVIEGERKTVTALFADIKGSMELMEDLDPEEARAIVDPALMLMIDAVHRYDGYIVQSTGDGIFALFGAPLAHEDHPQRALYAALKLQEELKRYSDRMRQEGRLPLQARVGVNTGEVVVRSIQTGAAHPEYTPIGHTANLAARMQVLAPVGSIAATKQVRKLCEGYFLFNSLGPTRVKGVSEPVNVYEVTGLGPLRTRLQRAVGRGLTKFVGREREMEAMKAAAEQADAGHGQIVAAMAEPGVGKSRLFYEFKATSQSGWMVLEALSVSFGKASAYLPVIDLMRNYFKIVSEDDERTRREKVAGRIAILDRTLEDTLPYLFSLLGIVEGDDPLTQMDGQIKKRRTLEAIKRMVLRESLNQPLMVIFEDLHWIDEQTQELLNLLVDSVGTAKILLLVNYRPEYSDPWGSKTYYTQLRLGPLGKESAEEMLAALLGTGKDLVPLKRLIIERTEGTPFFMEEIVQVLFEDGVLQRNGSVKLSKSMNMVKVPTTVQGALAARIDRLPAEEKELLQTLAVLGREFPRGLVRRVTLKPDDELERMLGRLQAGEFIYEQPAAGDAEYAFKHALTQEVAYNALLVERRKLLHERAGAALESMFAEQLDDHLDELAHHYSRSDNVLKASRYLQLAAEQASNRAAYAQATSSLETAMKLIERFPDSSERLRTELALRTTENVVSGVLYGLASEERHRAIERMCELAEQLGERSIQLRGLINLAHFYYPRGEALRTLELGRRCLELAEAIGEPEVLAAIHLTAGFGAHGCGRLAEATTHYRAAMSHAEQTNQRNSIIPMEPWSQAAGQAGCVLQLLGRSVEAVKLVAAGLSRAREARHHFTLGLSLTLEGWFHQYRREPEVVRAFADAAIALSEENGFPEWLSWGQYHRGWALAELGQVADGIAEMEKGIAGMRKLGGVPREQFSLVMLAQGYARLNQVDEALAMVENALGRVAATGERIDEAEMLRLRGEFLLIREGPLEEEAEQSFRAAIGVAREQEARWWELRATTSLARLLAKQGRREEARTMLADIYNWFTEGFDTADLKDAKALLDQLGA